MQCTIVKDFVIADSGKALVIDMYYIVFDLEWNQSPEGKRFFQSGLAI